MRSFVVCAVSCLIIVFGNADLQSDRPVQQHSQLTRSVRKVDSKPSAATDTVVAEQEAESEVEDDEESKSTDAQDVQAALGDGRRRARRREFILVKSVVANAINTCNGYVVGGLGDTHSWFFQRRRNAFDGWSARVELKTNRRRGRRRNCIHPNVKDSVRRRNIDNEDNVQIGIGWQDFIGNALGSEGCECLEKWLHEEEGNEKRVIEKMIECDGTCSDFREDLEEALPNAASLAEKSNGTLNAGSIASDGTVKQLDTRADSQEAQFVRAARRSHEGAANELDRSVQGKCN